jgi:integrase
MLDDAVWRGLVPSNPCEKVLRLKEDCKEKEILTLDEVQKLFPKNYKTIWDDREIAYVANRLGSLTGMRIGEILGLRGEFVYDNYILVCGQYPKYGYLPHTKTKKDRTIPLMPEMIGLLRKLMVKNGKGFLFSSDSRAVPVSQTYMRAALNDGLKKIGIDKKEALRRGLTLHGWRHFVNIDLLVQGLTTEQVQSVTGHKSKGMTERYSHIDPRQIADVIKAQEKIYGKKPDKGSKTQPPETGKAKQASRV